MRYKMLAVDLDGTALGAAPDAFAPGTLEAMTSAAAQGCQVVIATGRGLNTLPPGLNERRLPWLRYVVLYDGAEVWDLRARTCLRRKAIPAAALETAARIGEQYRIAVEYVDAAGRYHIAQRDWAGLDRLPLSGFHRTVLRQFAAPFTGSPTRFAGLGVLKLNLPCVPEAVWEPVCDAMRAAGMLPVACAPGALEVTSGAAGKLEAVRFLAGKLGLTLAEVMALGDSGNDAALLAAAGLGVAMGNAPADVQRAANLVTGANTESGAACAIRRFLLGESD